ncbi:MAG TPA: zinc-ribbon domain-containing protein [Bryobacteraceae bacterium]|nr:zinc-ribbon domain-containing protein [Bryobacteraceae bacterium]
MPFCTNCGSSIDPRASYCSQCGQKQPIAGRADATDFLTGISDRTASILCYIPVLGVIPAIIFLASQRFRGNLKVRFNAFQSLYLFVTWLIISSALPVLIVGIPGWGPEHAFMGALKAVLFICWIYLLVKAANLEQVRLPILGDLAARSTMEQL